MTTDFIICSFVTKNTVYEQIVRKYLIKSLNILYIPYHIEFVEDMGSWIKNTSQKPQAILNCLETFPDKNIVYVDADCIVKEYPSLFKEIPFEYDIGVHYLELDKFYESNKKELLSSVIFLRNTIITYNLVKKWKDRCEELKGLCWEQRILEKIIKEDNIRTYNLPYEYSYMLSLPKPKSISNFIRPIIVQCPTSRKL